MAEIEDLLKKYLRYEPDTGLFRWAVPRPKIRVGNIAGSSGKHKKGYITIFFNKKMFMAHRLAWFFYYGRWPKAQIDHIDLDKKNNRIENLREASNGQNCANRRPFGKSGLKGATFNKKTGRWCAQIKVNHKVIWLGYHESPESAHAAYVAAATKYHGEFARAL